MTSHRASPSTEAPEKRKALKAIPKIRAEVCAPTNRKSLAAKYFADSRRDAIGKLFEDLVAVQARLRAPGGCPWDREQTHVTLRTYLIEEAYEVLDAIEKGTPHDLAEELGDLLLQVLFHADLAREAGSFDVSDVITGIHDKMIRRHPHVFGNVKAETASEVLKNWAQLKAQGEAASSAKPPMRKIRRRPSSTAFPEIFQLCLKRIK